MKRFLSILMSVSLVAILLVSMSVTSMAAVTTPTSQQATITTTMEEVEDYSALDEKIMELTGEDYETAEEFLTDNDGYHIYKVTTTIGGLNLSSTIPTNNRYSGTYVSTFAIAYLIHDEALASYNDAALCWPDIEKDAALKITNIENTDAAFINTGTKLSESAPYDKTSEIESATSAYFEWYMVVNKDTFDMELLTHLASVTCCTVDTVARTTQPSASTHDALTYIGARKTTFPEGEFVATDATYHAATTTAYDAVTPYYSVVGGEIQAGGVEEPTTYEITFKNGDTVLNAGNTTYEEGADVTAPEAPTAPVDADEAYNYTFAGWSDGVNVYASNEIPVATEDVEYVATFDSAIKTYEIKFVVDGQTTTKTVNHGETPDYGSTPSKAGYNFTGWDPAIVPATGAATYTAQFSLIPPTEYEITFVVEGVETKINVIEGQTPVYPNGTPEKAGYNFTGWSPAIVPATGAATYTAQFELIPVEPEDDVVTMDEPVYIDGSNGNILPGAVETVKVNPFGTEHTVKAAELLRVHTGFTYDSSKGTLAEMGMLFVPKAVAEEAGVSTAETIIAADIAKDACCRNIPYLTGGGNVTFKAGLVDIPYKNIEIYAIPYYKLSGGERIYQAMQTILFE